MVGEEGMVCVANMMRCDGWRLERSFEGGESWFRGSDVEICCGFAGSGDLVACFRGIWIFKLRSGVHGRVPLSRA